MERVIHFEIPSDNPEKAMTFYGNVFGWSFNQMGQNEYWLIKTGEEQSNGINGGVMKKRDPNQPVVNTVKVNDISSTISKIEANAGTIVVPEFPIPGVGKQAFFKDTDGHIFGIMQFEK